VVITAVVSMSSAPREMGMLGKMSSAETEGKYIICIINISVIRSSHNISVWIFAH